MKATYLHVVALLAAISACGTSDGRLGVSGADVETPSAKTRTMGTAKAMPTTPGNLVFDPLFTSVGAPDTFLVFLESAAAQVEYPATSPAGPAAPVVRVTPSAATGVSAALAAQGGTGPFDVTVHVAFSPGADPTVSLATMAGDAYPLKAVDGADQIHGDRTYRTFGARIDGPAYGQIVLEVEPKGTDPVWLAAPEIVSAAESSAGAYHVATRAPLDGAALRRAQAIAARPFTPGRVKPRRAVLPAPLAQRRPSE